MSKLSASEDKLLKRGFDWATDINGYDPAWDDDAVLEYMRANPNEELMTNVATSLKLPVHRAIAARNRLIKAGKLPKAKTLTDFIKGQHCKLSEKPTSEKLTDKKPKPNRSRKQKTPPPTPINKTVETVPSSPLEQEPPRLIDSNGQLSLFFDNSDEAPDPDDFQNLADYEAAWDVWAEQHPELAAEFKKDIAPEVVGAIKTAEIPTGQQLETTEEAIQALNNETAKADTSLTPAGDTNFKSGDYVQLIKDPRRTGKLTITKGKYKVAYADGFKATHDKAELQLFSKSDSEVVLGESFFKVGEQVKCLLPTENRVFTVNRVYSTGMVSVLTGLDILSTLSYPANWLEHYIEEINPEPVPETSKKKRPAKGCGSGYLRVREANKKRNAAKGKDPDIYYAYYYSYSNQYGKEIKGSISVPNGAFEL